MTTNKGFGDYPSISLVARPGKTFVGFEGVIADDRISCIGVLEYSRDPCSADTLPLTFTEKQLWDSGALMDPSMNKHVEAYPYEKGSLTSNAEDRVLSKLRPVLLRDREGGRGCTLSSISSDADLDDIKYYNIDTASLRLNMAGKDTQITWFPIDGVHGERVVGIEVAVAELPSALRVSDGFPKFSRVEDEVLTHSLGSYK